ncbi:DUF2913 family protein [Aliivibrio fischeri]|uniref:DUF2913 family protein n=1 Tax=Aliivibrio fischeri TaxID=668 RepID=UPI002E2A8B0F|nr:DUF2913 family protein [Aliivibrio fischeri]
MLLVIYKSLKDVAVYLKPGKLQTLFIRWVTTAIKSQRCTLRCKRLMTWQKEGRTKGTGTQLPVRLNNTLVYTLS